MLSVVLGLVFGDEIVQCAHHVGVESIKVVLDGIGQDASVFHQMVEVYVEGRELELAQAVDLGDVVLVSGDGA